jgi:hypothetical protein
LQVRKILGEGLDGNRGREVRGLRYPQTKERQDDQNVKPLERSTMDVLVESRSLRV